MRKILIFGNSGSGKSTLSKEFVGVEGIAHLDLDTLAWQAAEPPQRKPLAQSRQAIDAFLAHNDGWVIDGCYADLLALVTDTANEMIFLDLPVEDCIANTRGRPWEPHKYPSKAAQDANLDAHRMDSMPIPRGRTMNAPEPLIRRYSGVSPEENNGLPALSGRQRSVLLVTEQEQT